MKKFINKPDDFLNESLSGFGKAHSDIIKVSLDPSFVSRKNKTKEPAQNLTNVRIRDFFVFGQENIIDFDNSINSFVGCCSLGTGHLDSLIKYNYGNIRLSPLLQNDSRS